MRDCEPPGVAQGGAVCHVSQLDDLHVLEVPTMSALGSPAEIAGRFGSPAALREAGETLGELL